MYFKYPFGCDANESLRFSYQATKKVIVGAWSETTKNMSQGEMI